VWKEKPVEDDADLEDASEVLQVALAAHAPDAKLSTVCSFYITRALGFCASSKKMLLSNQELDCLISFYTRAGREDLAASVGLPLFRIVACNKARVGGLEVKLADFVLATAFSVLPSAPLDSETPCPLITAADIIGMPTFNACLHCIACDCGLSSVLTSFIVFFLSFFLSLLSISLPCRLELPATSSQVSLCHRTNIFSFPPPAPLARTHSTFTHASHNRFGSSRL
jgi:hypothetical protein